MGSSSSCLGYQHIKLQDPNDRDDDRAPLLPQHNNNNDNQFVAAKLQEMYSDRKYTDDRLAYLLIPSPLTIHPCLSDATWPYPCSTHAADECSIVLGHYSNYSFVIMKTKIRTIDFHLPAIEKERYPPNVARNTKYNLVSFLPAVLWEQFRFFLNFYFLAVALSQLVPAWKIGYIETYVVPLCVVLAVTIIKEAVDDMGRYRRDQEANSKRYRILTLSGVNKTVPSSKIRVGDVIIVNKNQNVPADMILLRTTEESGACFIRTDQLDGETDWKLRIAVPSCQALASDESLLDLNASVSTESPHKDIHSFAGNFMMGGDGPGQHTTPLTIDNTLWTNTVVASGNAIGFVIYTGKDTRAVMNTKHPRTKVGLLDSEVDRLSKILFVCTLALSLAMIALNGFQGLWYIYLFRFVILFSSIIPISLRVNLDMAKIVYKLQIEHDKKIKGTIVRTSTIPEELGRIEYLLSDKTGTLTQNDMELKKLHIGAMSYNAETMGEISSNLRAAYAPHCMSRTNKA
ncbi:putative aminophospholipid-translocase [Dissophora ornata]|nr:putative aminophospholipid-translocase [Dissophora ornata]